MKTLLTILPLIILFSLGASAQNRKDKKLLSTSFLDKDSVIIEISYTEIPNCVESYYGTLIFIKNKDEVIVKYKKPRTDKWITKNVMSDRTTLYIQSFEREAKDGKRLCGGFIGGNGIEVRLRISGKVTEFSYCKDEWDGIGELLSKFDLNE